MAKAGWTYPQMAKGFFVCRRTFLYWRKRQPELQAAIDAGRQGMADEISEALARYRRESPAFGFTRMKRRGIEKQVMQTLRDMRWEARAEAVEARDKARWQ